jgi:hypothetical protein
MAVYREDRAGAGTIAKLGARESSSYEDSYILTESTESNAHVYGAGQMGGTRSVGGHTLEANSYRVQPLGGDNFRVVVVYTNIGGSDDPFDPKPYLSARSFDTSGGTEHITQAFNEERFGEAAENMNRAIGADGDRVQGIDVVVPALKWTETYDVPSGYVTAGYIKLVADLTGTVNSGAYKSFLPGELLFLGASGSQQSESRLSFSPWSLSFNFAARKNLVDFEIPGVGPITKKGWEYLWIKYRPEVEGGIVVTKPIAAYVDQVYETADLSALGIGG